MNQQKRRTTPAQKRSTSFEAARAPRYMKGRDKVMFYDAIHNFSLIGSMPNTSQVLYAVSVLHFYDLKNMQVDVQIVQDILNQRGLRYFNRSLTPVIEMLNRICQHWPDAVIKD